MKTKFCQLNFRGRSTLHKIGEFYLTDHGQQPQFGQNAILARSKAKTRNWKIINCFLPHGMTQRRLDSRHVTNCYQSDSSLNMLMADPENFPKARVVAVFFGFPWFVFNE